MNLYSKNNNRTDRKRLAITAIAVAVLASWLIPADSVNAEIRLGTLCRVKGQEENVLQGLGIVTGLPGTGDGASFRPAIKSLAGILNVMGEQVGPNGEAITDTKNVALVMIRATIPASGARQGDKVDCVISSIGTAKSLKGGQLFLSPLVGPDRNNPQIYAFASGPITLDSEETPTSGKIFAGCKIEEDFFTPFVKDGKITLVLHKYYSSWRMADDIAETINNPDTITQFGTGNMTLARAIDQSNVEVVIPPQYRDNPVQFIALILDSPILETRTGPRVVINERAGSIVVSGDVEIGPVLVSHRNITIQAGQADYGNRFIPVDPAGETTPNQKLEDLVEALNAVRVPTKDIIEIIKGLQADGKLYANLIIN